MQLKTERNKRGASRHPPAQPVHLALHELVLRAREPQLALRHLHAHARRVQLIVCGLRGARGAHASVTQHWWCRIAMHVHARGAQLIVCGARASHAHARTHTHTRHMARTCSCARAALSSVCVTFRSLLRAPREGARVLLQGGCAHAPPRRGREPASVVAESSAQQASKAGGPKRPKKLTSRAPGPPQPRCT